MIRNFLSLTKPGIIFGNIITTCGGFFLACNNTFNSSLFIKTILGTIFIIASGCVLNNIIDKDIDALMERTKNRVLVKNLISIKVAFIFSTILAIISLLFFFYINFLCIYIGLFGLLMYVIVYSLYFKRKSIYGTFIGSISGAIPPLIGYVAISNKISLESLLLFIILCLWQLPHSFAIAIYRFSDFKNAKIPLLPIVTGINNTKIIILVTIILFSFASTLLMVYSNFNIIFILIMILLNFFWIYKSINGYHNNNDIIWARNMFIFSIIIISLLSLILIMQRCITFFYG